MKLTTSLMYKVRNIELIHSVNSELNLLKHLNAAYCHNEGKVADKKE